MPEFTTEQARAVAQRLREASTREIADGDYVEAAIDAVDTLASEVETQTKRIAGYELLVRSMEQRLDSVHETMEATREAVKTLQSEREANTILTAEVERLSAKATDFEDRWYKVCDVANGLRAQLRTYQEREKTMGWSQS